MSIVFFKLRNSRDQLNSADVGDLLSYCTAKHLAYIVTIRFRLSVKRLA